MKLRFWKDDDPAPENPANARQEVAHLIMDALTAEAIPYRHIPDSVGPLGGISERITAVVPTPHGDRFVHINVYGHGVMADAPGGGAV